MYRKVEDFLNDWNMSAQGTLNVFKAITNEKLDQSIIEGHNSLGWLANHLVGSIGAFGGLVGLDIPKTEQTSDIEEMIKAYEVVSQSLKGEATHLTDEALLEELEGFVGPAP